MMLTGKREAQEAQHQGTYHCAALWSGVAAFDKANHDHKDATALACHAALRFEVAAACRDMCWPYRAPNAVSLPVPDQVATGQEGFKHRVWQAFEERQVSQDLQP